MSMEVMALGESDIRQRVCILLEVASYRSKRFLMLDGRGVEKSVLLMLARVSRVHVRRALGHTNDVRAKPR